MSLPDRWTVGYVVEPDYPPARPRVQSWGKQGRPAGPAGADGLTDHQREVFRYLYEVTRETGIQPSVREMAARFGLSSTNGIMCHIKGLIRKGWLGEGRLHSRSLRFIRRPDGSPFTGFADRP